MLCALGDVQCKTRQLPYDEPKSLISRCMPTNLWMSEAKKKTDRDVHYSSFKKMIHVRDVYYPLSLLEVLPLENSRHLS